MGFRFFVGITALLGLTTAIVLMMIVEWKKIVKDKNFLVSTGQRIRRIVTGVLLIVVLGLCLYGWVINENQLTITGARFYIGTLTVVMLVVSGLIIWDLLCSISRIREALSREIEYNVSTIEDLEQSRENEENREEMATQ
ncbi:MAG: hypothetical protein ABEJ65_05765 [bacterium]